MTERLQANPEENFAKDLERVAEGEIAEWKGLTGDQLNVLEATIHQKVFLDPNVDPADKDWRLLNNRIPFKTMRDGQIGDYLSPTRCRARDKEGQLFNVVAGPLQVSLSRRKSNLNEQEAGITLGVEQLLPRLDGRTVHTVSYSGLLYEHVTGTGARFPVTRHVIQILGNLKEKKGARFDSATSDPEVIQALATLGLTDSLQ